MNRILYKYIRKITYTAISAITVTYACSIAMSSLAFSADKSSSIIYQADGSKTKQKKKKFTHFTSGTGFFVNNNYIITNEHVVQGCKSVKIRGAVNPTYAKIQAIDTENDLALLKASHGPERVAMLRGEEMPAYEGEAVTVMGYPLESGIRGQHVIKKATITDAHDVYDGISRIQFTDSVEKGNSGGPLLDDNGNVIGVIVGKMSFYLADASTAEGIAPKPVKTSSMAISLDSLKSFLNANNVYFKENHIQYNHPDEWMEQKAQKYIVNVHCIKG